jgi:predicted Zn finger-like uncharacterized protein
MTGCGFTGGVIGMRLVCPNCDAQYEVDDAAIPDGGRDVQCSNCGHAWFQLPPGLADAEPDAEEAALFQSPPPVAASPEPTATVVLATAEDVPEEDEPAPNPPPRRTLDDAVLAVLREEAEREAAARRAEAARGVEVQPDLGLSAPLTPPKAAPEPATPHVTADTDYRTQPPVAQRPGARRDLLPDIEEINSTLRAGSEARELTAEEAEAAVAAKSGGFRAGFAAVLVVAVVLVALYVMAPRIALHLPGSAAAMETYVAAIDGARVWLDGAMQGAVMRLRGLTGQGG